MSTFFRCENGHRWNPLSRRFAHSSKAGNECPYCSASVSLNATEALETPQNLAPATFTAKSAYNPERIHAMAIYCSDGRFGEAFDEFCHQSLKIPRYDRFAVPGGPAWINPTVAAAQDLYRSARAQLDFLVRVHDLERIVLITHSPCAFYSEHLQKSPHECLEAQFSDTHTAAQHPCRRLSRPSRRDEDFVPPDSNLIRAVLPKPPLKRTLSANFLCKCHELLRV
jgi:hypothetical protein